VWVECYAACKQPDFIMLLYIFTTAELIGLLRRLGYELTAADVQRRLNRQNEPRFQPVAHYHCRRNIALRSRMVLADLRERARPGDVACRPRRCGVDAQS
jgi:hypothetical protein